MPLTPVYMQEKLKPCTYTAVVGQLGDAKRGIKLEPA